MPKRLLVIDPIPTHRIRLKAALRAAQYEIVSVDRVACAKSVIATELIDLILLNTSGTQPSQTMARLHKAIGDTGIPILCRDDEMTPERRMQALDAGAREMFSTDAPLALLLARLRGLLRDSEAEAELERRRIAAASFGFREDAAQFQARSQVVSVILGAPNVIGQEACLSGSHQTTAMTYEELLNDRGQKCAPDAVVLNVGANGAEQLVSVLPEIRVRRHLRGAAVIVFHAQGAHDIAQLALNLGAADIAEEGSSDAEVAHRIDQMLARKRVRDALQRSTEQSFRMATTDALTGLFNRRYAEVYLTDALLAASENGRGPTVMMVDIDHFKAINDTHGHAVGDAVLCRIAERLQMNLRAVDLVSRHGGEEFLIVLPDIDGSEAELAADRLCATIAADPFVLPDGREIVVTVSIGVACAGEPSPAVRGPFDRERRDLAKSVIDELLARADRALYRAKNGGRNRVAVSVPSVSAA